jgi:uncharacterized protein YbbC (DUF1343 family)
MIKKFFIWIVALFDCLIVISQPTINPSNNQTIVTGAERISVYLPLIKGKTVGIFANQTSVVGNKHLVDTLRSLGINIKVIFS